MTQQQALTTAFGAGVKIERQTHFLTKQQVARVATLAEGEARDEMVVRYVATKNGQPAGIAYFDTHKVRTMPETLMIVVRPDGAIERIEIVSFAEPRDYLPKQRWIDQFDGKSLTRELSLQRSIRPISGATLSGRSMTVAARRVLAIHTVIEESKR